MYGSMELCATYYVCMDGYICAGYLLCWIYMCWIFMWWIYMCCEIFVVIIVGYKKNRTKKRQCRLFAVRGRRQRPLCRRWQTAKGARGAHLCFLGMDHLANLPTVADDKAKLMAKTLPLPSAVADGKKQRALTHCWRQLADGKEALKFAVRWRTAKAAVSRLTD